ncbi:proline-rich protein 23C-like [Cervus canadensis]|uniref:proline-rich protein 23C-like n=1 Tax=Cervus canadensis TaxID=1574408 RepID=UPI001C9E68F3|nr:proline-rich protein 23C-like [Cervus canadensis]
MGSRPRSPGAYSSDRWGNQAGEPGPAKRRRTEERARPESESETAPSVDNLTGSTAAGALTRVVFLPAGCALHLPLDDIDLVLEPEPTSVLQVALGDFILTLVPEALLGSRVEGPSGQVLERAAVLSPPGEYTALEPGFCAAVPEVACEEEANADDADLGADFLSPGMDVAGDLIAGLRSPAARVWRSDAQGFFPEFWPRAPNPSAERRSSHHDDHLDVHLLEPFPDSPLQPLPPSPSPSPQERPQRPHGPARKARRCLFPE